LKYRGIEGEVHFNKDMRKFVGELKNTKYLVTFSGRSLNEVVNNFHKSVESYQNTLNKKSTKED